MNSKDNLFDTAFRFLVVGILIMWCFWIVSPFVLPLVWAIVVAVAIFPMYKHFEKIFGGKRALSAGVFTALMVIVLILPLWAVSGSLMEYTEALASILKDGSIGIPAADEQVKDWPVIGGKVYELWNHASVNLGEVVEQFQDQIMALSSALLESIAGFGFAMLQFLFSTIIAGILLANRDRSVVNMNKLMVKLSGEKGAEYLPLIGATIRSIAQGVIGISAVQAILAYFGFWLASVPGASFWALAVLVLAIVQLPPTLIILPIIIYVFSVSSTTVGVIFCIYMIAVSLSDSFMKPLVLGRGVDVPMITILIGSIGGMIAFGIIGLFVGSVVLAICYKLYIEWLNSSEEIS